MTIETHSSEETIEAGRRVGAACGPGTLISLSGDLGAGKTRFVKGLGLGLGLEDADVVTSPTFALLNVYTGRCPLAHFDLYRLDAVDLPSLGYTDVRDTSVVALEWGEKADEAVLGDHVRVDFEITGETSRCLLFSAQGPSSEALLKRLNL